MSTQSTVVINRCLAISVVVNGSNTLAPGSAALAPTDSAGNVTFAALGQTLTVNRVAASTATGGVVVQSPDTGTAYLATALPGTAMPADAGATGYLLLNDAMFVPSGASPTNGIPVRNLTSGGICFGNNVGLAPGGVGLATYGSFPYAGICPLFTACNDASPHMSIAPTGFSQACARADYPPTWYATAVPSVEAVVLGSFVLSETPMPGVTYFPRSYCYNNS